MGWIPRTRIFRFGANNIYDTTITLSALYGVDSGHYLMARIPIDKTNRFTYLTVEYRVRDASNLESALPDDRILVHLVQKVDATNYRSFLLVNTAAALNLRNTLSNVDQNYTKITLVSTSSNRATVRIVSTLPYRCKQVFRDGMGWVLLEERKCISVIMRHSQWATNVQK